MHFVYIVRCADGTLYTGYARDPQAREKAHNSGRGARYTAGRRPVRLVYSEAFDSPGDALRREYQLKRWSRRNKEALIRRRSHQSGELWRTSSAVARIKRRALADKSPFEDSVDNRE